MGGASGDPCREGAEQDGEVDGRGKQEQYQLSAVLRHSHDSDVADYFSSFAVSSEQHLDAPLLVAVQGQVSQQKQGGPSTEYKVKNEFRDSVVAFREC